MSKGKKRKSSQWNDDHFTKKAQKEHYVARSIYKLQEIDRREKVFENARSILDLGAAPGSWSQYCLEQSPETTIVAIDLKPLEITDSRIQFIRKPIEEVDFEKQFKDQKFDLVLSDMAPKTTGIRSVDEAQSIELAQLALQTAQKTLHRQGSFVVKLFMGGDFEVFNQDMKEAFSRVKLIRPESTRKHSKEIFFIGNGIKIIGRPQTYESHTQFEFNESDS